MYLCKAQSRCRLSLVQIGPYLPGLQHNVMYQLRPQSNPKSVTLSLNHWKSNRIELVWKTIHSNCAKLPIYLDSGPGQFCLAINSTKKYPTTCYSRKSGTGTSKTIGTTFTSYKRIRIQNQGVELPWLLYHFQCQFVAMRK